MTTRPTTHTGPTLTLSAEARAALRLPLFATATGVLGDNAGRTIGAVSIWTSPESYVPIAIDAELAAFVAALVNAALTPIAAPALTGDELAAMGDAAERG